MLGRTSGLQRRSGGGKLHAPHAGWDRWRRGVAALYAEEGAFLLAVTLCGMVFGLLVAGQLSPNDRAWVSHALARLIAAASAGQILPSDQLWAHRALADAGLIALIWAFGLSLLCNPGVVAVVFLRAFGTGFAVGFAVLTWGWRGLILAGTVILLHQALALLALLAAGVSAMRFSAAFLRRSQLRSFPRALTGYTCMLGACAAWMAASAAWQAYVAPFVLSALWGRG
ncbi:hypothetical protein GCM10010885_01620 [Alicyclobacillus cellulosilyticus]|uniref:Stage II sporulation protein M n=1 Tax=Alicyclobacillus cellulosilyticus TaxID=1003997 RepID=A0A917K225_9BACL|nr:stage II sporulation protein M [Alicyclobacillus cellulosilyticus]GGI95635.1 hypothetical protein GCM10010885_01620 [Alicyclobacillus cellulosilyticus]